MGILIPLLGITAGIVAIITIGYIKIKQIELEKTTRINTDVQDNNQFLKEKVKALILENADLRNGMTNNADLKNRLTNLEAIAASKEWEFLLPPNVENLSNQQKADIIAKKL